MRSLKILVLLMAVSLMSVMCTSCRSSKQTAVVRSDSTLIVTEEAVGSDASMDLFSFIDDSRELELSGITIEFWTPDSAHHDAIATPKTVHINNVKAKESKQQSTHEQTTVVEREAQKLCVQHGSSSHEKSKSVDNRISPPDWIFVVTLAGSLIIIAIALFLKFRK